MAHQNPMQGRQSGVQNPMQQPQQAQQHSPQPQQAAHSPRPEKPAKPQRVKYKTKTIRVSAYNTGAVARQVARGWEVVSTYGGALGTVQTVTLRKPK